MPQISTSPSLTGVRYDLRGALVRRARELEASGRQITHLDIGNVSRFGFHPPASLVDAIHAKLADSDAYEHEQGIHAARAAILAQQRARGVTAVDLDRIFIGNGVSSLIDITLRALLTKGEQVLLPCPDYPLWTAATVLNGGEPCYYHCPTERRHVPDPDEIESLISPKTRAIVLINPNNPTGAVYPRALLERLVALADRHDLVLLSDEIYDGLTYENAPFTPLAPLAGDVPCVTFSGLSKVYRACGYRMGWMTLSGAAERVANYRDALQLLASLHLCANVPMQQAIPAAIDGAADATQLTRAGGRLYRARQTVLDAVADSAFLDIVPPQGALYAFVSIRAGMLPTFDDHAFALRLLEEQSVLVTPGSSFNEPSRRHLRLTLLPEPAVLADVMRRIETTLSGMSAVRKVV